MKSRHLPFLALGIAALWAIGVQAAPTNNLRIQIVDERGAPLRDVVVQLDTSARPAGMIRFPWRLAMAQKGLQFAPGTLVVPKGGTVAFPNLDQVRHSIYSFSKPAKFSIDLYGRDQTRSQGFPIVGSVAIGCNIHDQMRGYIRVVDTPYAGKTDGNGVVTFAALPAGTAKLSVWHPALRAPKNEIVQTIAIAPGNGNRKIPIRVR